MQCFRCQAKVITKGAGVLLAERPAGWVEVEAHVMGTRGTKRAFVCPECWNSLSSIDQLVGHLRA